MGGKCFITHSVVGVMMASNPSHSVVVRLLQSSSLNRSIKFAEDQESS